MNTVRQMLQVWSPFVTDDFAAREAAYWDNLKGYIVRNHPIGILVLGHPLTILDDETRWDECVIARTCSEVVERPSSKCPNSAYITCTTRLTWLV